MNTNELAEQLDEYVGNNGYSHNDYADSMSQAATTLRQQQAEIAQLKHMNLNWQISEGMLLTELDALKEENAKIKTKLIGHGLVKALDNFGKAQEK